MLAEFANSMAVAGVLIHTIKNNSAEMDYRLVNRCSAEDNWTILDVCKSLTAADKDNPSIFSKVYACRAYNHISLAPNLNRAEPSRSIYNDGSN